MSPKTLTKLKAACLYVDGEHRKGTAPETVIQTLIDNFGGNLAFRAGANTLRCGAVESSCTYSRGAPLLARWRRLAGATLQVESRK